MTTATDIANMALRRIGANSISDLHKTQSKEASVAREFYDEARRELLNLCHWNFAAKRVELTRSATAPAFGWDYAYILPTDLVRVISVHPTDNDNDKIPYSLEFQDSDDRVLLCNAEDVYIRYVFDMEDVNLMPPSFREALALRLARDFAAAIPQSASSAELWANEFRRKLTNAKSIDGVEDYPQKLDEGDWIKARQGNYTDWNIR